jgi:hypothetical protein
VSVTSPQTYNTCFKGYVVDIWHMDGQEGLPDFNWVKEVKVTWAGPGATTRAECEDMEGAAILYDNSAAGWVHPWTQSVQGKWVRTLGAFWTCTWPSMTFSIPRVWATRVAATMRLASGSNPTVPVKVSVTTTNQGDFF